jgi:hypothetical protein
MLILSQQAERCTISGGSFKEMKKAKKELEEQIHQQRLSELDELIQEKGLSFDELKEMLSK